MMRTFVAVAGMTAAVLAASPAGAQAKQEFGDKGEFIIGADRLMPLLAYSHFSRSLPPPGTAMDASHSGDNTTFGLFFGSTLDLNNPGNNQQDFPSSTFFSVPRVGLDYVVAPNFTLGGEFVLFFTLGGGRSTQVTFINGTSMTSQQESRSLTLVGGTLRAGYILKLSDLFSVWLRGGLSGYNGTQSFNSPQGTTTLTDSQHTFALDLEPQLVFTPIPHVGFTAALNVDLAPLGGYSHQDNQTGQNTNGSANVVFLGLTLGMITYF